MRLPMPHQYFGYTWLRENPRGMCCSSMRTGKTLTGVYSVRGLGPGVVLCPASLKTTWRDEFLLSDPTLKIEIVSGRSFAFSADADVYIINYDILPDHFKSIPLRAKTNWAICDEFHKAKNPEARRTGATMALMRQAKVAHPFSGTPMPSRPIEWWPTLNALGITPLSWEDYARRYAAAWEAPWGFDTRGASNLDELRQIIAPHMIRVTKEQLYKDYISPEFRLIAFDRPVNAQESAFDIAHIFQFDNPIVSIEGLSEVLKQSALAKLPDCLEFIEGLLETEAKLVVFGYHKEVLHTLQDMLSVKSVLIDGNVSMAKRDIYKTQFRDDPETRVILGNLQAMGEGNDLSVADTTVFVETGWVPAAIQQASERTQSMFKMGVSAMSYILTVEKSIDHYQLTKIWDKIVVINSILA